MGHNSVVSSYLKSTGIPRVDGWSTDPRVLGRHSVGTMLELALALTLVSNLDF